MCIKMRVTSVIAVFVFSATFAQTSDNGSPRGYHRLEGIPTAARIKAMEERIHSERILRAYGDTLDYKDYDQYSFFGGVIIRLPELDVSYCGSSLLNSNRLVTAAHCWDDGVTKALSFTVVLGSPFLYRYNEGLRLITDKIVTHPEYEVEANGRYKNDIAIVHIPEVVHNNVVFPVTILDATMPLFGAWYAGLGRVVVGFGTISKESQIRKFTIRFMEIADCQKSFPFDLDPELHLCVETNGIKNATCQCDSGAPLMAYARPYLFGVLSQQSDPLCGKGGGPTLFSRVHGYLNFIKAHVTLPKFEFDTTIEHEPETMVENITMYLNYTYKILHKYN